MPRTTPAAKCGSGPFRHGEGRQLAARKIIERRRSRLSPLTPIYPATSTGRRLALARWITHPDNPLTARVAINQIWMRPLRYAAGADGVRLRPQRQAARASRPCSIGWPCELQDGAGA